MAVRMPKIKSGAIENFYFRDCFNLTYFIDIPGRVL
jgi:hypothetical protein